MYPILFTQPLNISAHFFLSAIYLFLSVLAVLLLLIANFTIYEKRSTINKKLWQETITGLISQAIFAEEGESGVHMTKTLVTLLRKQRFRNCLTNELIKATSNLSGTSRQNLQKLYELLALDKDSLKKLKHLREHIKAKGLQELATMEQFQHVKKIFRLTNNRNELVRNEAQCALVGFYGFVGLRFLNVTAYPISQWQQIQLLNKLNKVEATHFEPLKKWLQSANESVVIFALKLAAYYNCSNVYTEVARCMQSKCGQVRLYAIQYLKKSPGDDSAEQMISQYFVADKNYRLAVLDALVHMGGDKEIFFAQQQLRNADDDIKMAAAKCLAKIHPLGMALFQTHVLAGQHPWSIIFLQIQNERAA